MKDKDEATTIGMIGIGGSGMRGLAYLLAKKGKHIIGTDSRYESLASQLKSEPSDLMNEQSFMAAIKDCEIIIYTDAVNENNPLIATAKQHSVQTKSYSQALGDFSKKYSTIAISGTHGKSTTTAMLAHILIKNEYDPTVLIGAGVAPWGDRHARVGKGKYMIVEADEYRDHFLTLQPKHIIITSIEHEHPDYFPELKDTLHSFQKFINKLEPNGTIVVLKSVINSHKSLKWPSSTVIIDDELVKDIKINIPGEHMRLNALLALSMGVQIGINRELALGAINNYKGIRRRFEMLGRYKKMDIISDYGHHPTAIRETLKASKEIYGNKQILIIFEGHTASRLNKFSYQFIEELSKSDELIIAPVFLPKGRSNKNNSIQALDKIKQGVKSKGAKVSTIENYSQLGPILTTKSNDYDVVIGFSAGDLDNELRKIVKSHN